MKDESSFSAKSESKKNESVLIEKATPANKDGLLREEGKRKDYSSPP